MKMQFSYLSARNVGASATLALLGAVLAPLMQAQTTILSEDFSTDRTVQNLPNASAWYYSKTSNFVSQSDGKLTVATNSSEGGTISNLVTYFTDSSTVNLGVGDRLSMNFSFQMERGAVIDGNGLFRVGVYNSGGSRLTADGLGQTNSIYNGYRGYTFGIDTRRSNREAPLRLYDRDKNNATLSSITNAHTQVGDVQGSWATNAAFVNGSDYLGSLVITRSTTDSITISLVITGEGIGSNYAGSWTINGGYTSFDTFALMTGNATGLLNFSIDNLDITLANIPEPSSVAAVVGLGVLLLCAVARRRRQS